MNAQFRHGFWIGILLLTGPAAVSAEQAVSAHAEIKPALARDIRTREGLGLDTLQQAIQGHDKEALVALQRFLARHPADRVILPPLEKQIASLTRDCPPIQGGEAPDCQVQIRLLRSEQKRVRDLSRSAISPTTLDGLAYLAALAFHTELAADAGARRFRSPAYADADVRDALVVSSKLVAESRRRLAEGPP